MHATKQTEDRKTRKKRTAFVITPVHDLLLRDLNKLQLATAEQLTRHNYKTGMMTTVQERLKDLVDHGYLLALSQPTIRGRAAYIYALARKGLTYLDRTGVEVREYFRPSKEKALEENYLFLSHSLALTDVLIASDLFLKAHPTYHIKTLLHERTLKKTPFKTRWQRQGKEE